MTGITFNWGTGIFLFYTVFASVLFYAVYESTKHDNSLVVENYYDYDLAYQQQYDRLENTALLEEPFKMNWSSSDKQLTLQFPAVFENAKVEGDISFYRPNNKSLDWNLPIAINEANEMPVDLSKLPAGRWKAQVKWEANGTPYFAERTIDIR